MSHTKSLSLGKRTEQSAWTVGQLILVLVVCICLTFSLPMGYTLKQREGSLPRTEQKPWTSLPVTTT